MAINTLRLRPMVGRLGGIPAKPPPWTRNRGESRRSRAPIVSLGDKEDPGLAGWLGLEDRLFESCGRDPGWTESSIDSGGAGSFGPSPPC